uniref:Uncharacterized protein n=2 Tax=viral metagenome TaxID=1070528 RepID=A0A6M3XMF4_9ZZZZ
MKAEMSALDELVKPENWNKSSMAWRGEGYPADIAEHAAAELAQLRRLRDNYKATSELLAIREEQIGELLNEKAQLRAALDEARKVAESDDSDYEADPTCTCCGHFDSEHDPECLRPDCECNHFQRVA